MNYDLLSNSRYIKQFYFMESINIIDMYDINKCLIVEISTNNSGAIIPGSSI